ncbi:MAG: hypothetical protein OEW99_00205 [Gammaproteobacteria bacterium]|nr:hypothetical protein [Gammaproteobacteria bacterium]
MEAQRKKIIKLLLVFLSLPFKAFNYPINNGYQNNKYKKNSNMLKVSNINSVKCRYIMFVMMVFLLSPLSVMAKQSISSKNKQAISDRDKDECESPDNIKTKHKKTIRLCDGEEHNHKKKDRDNIIVLSSSDSINIVASSIKKNKPIIGIDGSNGDDTITSNGDINIDLIRASENTKQGKNKSNHSNSRRKNGAPELSDYRKHLTPNITILTTGISGGKGDDIITNNGSLDVSNKVTSNILKGVFSGDAIYATGISGDEGNDTIRNNGEINTTSTSTFIRFADAQATGIDGAEDQDSIENSGTITTSADATAFTLSGGISYARSDAKAISINGGDQDDTIINTGTIETNASSTALTGEVTLSIQGRRPADTTTTAIAQATAIDGGSGDDVINNSGTLSSSASAVASGLFGTVAAGNKALFKSISGVSSDASANGINSSAGDDTINNKGLIQVNAESLSLAGAGTMSIEDAALADSVTEAKSTAIAIDGGGGDDDITNEGEIISEAVATAGAMNFSFSSSGNAQVTHEGGTNAESIATGITGDGGASSNESDSALVLSRKAVRSLTQSSETVVEGDDNVMNNAVITAKSIATSGALGASISIEGAAQSDTSSKATASAVAIDAGAGDDNVKNSGELNANAVATAGALNAAFSLSGDAQGSHEGGASAEAIAKGLSGDGEASSSSSEGKFEIGIAKLDIEKRNSEKAVAGEDSLSNEANITARADAISGAFDVSISSEGAARSNTTSTAKASAVAIDGGAGDDSITNVGELISIASATAGAVNGAVTLSGDALGSHEGGATAEAVATGLSGDGGASSISNETKFKVDNEGVSYDDRSNQSALEGEDLIINTASITTTSVATSGAVGEAISIEGASQSDTRSTAKANSTAIDAGAGDDNVDNSGELNADAVATAVALNITFSEKEGSQVSNEGGATAEAVATGISGDGVATSSGSEEQFEIGYDGLSYSKDGFETAISGDDSLTNHTVVKTSATATSGAVGVAISIEGAAQSDTSSKATASAVAIDAGAGDDNVKNSGELNANAVATAGALKVAFSQNGDAQALHDGGVTAEAIATGITGDGEASASERVIELDINADGLRFKQHRKETTIAGDDILTNEAAINTVAVASSGEIGAAITLKGGSLSESTSKAKSTAIAIDGGNGNDEITNFGLLNSTAISTAVVANISVSQGKGKSIVKGGTEAEAIAVGIDADGEGSSFSSTTTLDGSLEGVSFKNEVLKESNSGNDNVINGAEIQTTATAVAPGLGVAVGVKGAAVSMLESTAKAHAVAIDLGDGNDSLINTGVLDVKARAVAATTNVPVASGSKAAIALGGPEAEATAIGVDADGEGNSFASRTEIDVSLDGVLFNNETRVKSDSGDDTVTNEGNINTAATSVTPELDLPVSMKGISVGITAAKATTHSIAIDLGGGNDVLRNAGTLDAKARSVAVSANIPITSGKSLAMAIGGPEAEATAVGIDADGDASSVVSSTAIAINLESASLKNELLIENDSGNDFVINHGHINATATAVTPAVDAPTSMSGLSVAITSAKSTSKAAAIDLGGGNDELHNSGTLDAKARSVAAAASVAATMGKGAAISLGGPEAEANAVGIDADGDASNVSVTSAIDASLDGLSYKNEIIVKNDSGDDTVINDANVNATATAVSPEVDIDFASTGVSVGVTAAKATSKSIAIDLGGGDDSLTNSGTLDAKARSVAVAANIPVTGKGVAIALGGPEAEATAVGIDADGDANNLTVTTKIDTTLDGANFESEFIIENDGGDDSVDNSGDILATATAVSPELDVAYTTAGVAAAASAAKATSKATAIDLGGGNDELFNTGKLDAKARSVAVAAAVSVVGGTGGAISIGGPEADASAIAIDADGDATNVLSTTSINTSFENVHFGNQIIIENESGNDHVINQGNLSATATAVSPELDVGVTTSVLALGVSAAKATSQAAAIDLGAGNDVLDSTGTLNAKARSVALAVNVPVASSVGFAISLGGPEAQATAIGIDADGEGSNFSAKTAIDTTLSNASFSNEIKITNDSGNDSVTNDGDVNATATAVSPEVDVAVAVTGLAVNESAATSTSKAAAIDLGGGDDSLSTNGALNAKARSVAVAANVSVTTGGVAISLGGTEAEATAVGISADGEASNTDVSTSINATDEKVGFVSKVVIENDSGNDAVTNDGDINVDATAVSPALGVAVAVQGVSASIVTADAIASATAINLGDGDDEVNNIGKLNVIATSNADSINVSVAPAGVALAANSVWNGGTKAVANATGIDTDGSVLNSSLTTKLESSSEIKEFVQSYSVTAASGNDKVNNEGDIRVDSVAIVPSVGVSFTGGGLAATIATAESKAASTAIITGDGEDEITNSGKLTSVATSNADSINVAVTPAGVALAADAIWNGGTHSEAVALGISSDGQEKNSTNQTQILYDSNGLSISHSKTIEYASSDDLVKNDGDIVTVATAVAPSIGVSVAVAGVAGVITTASSDAQAIAIETGGGNDEIYNTGDLSSYAISNADAISVSVTPAGLAVAANAVWDGGVSATSRAEGINTNGIKQKHTSLSLGLSDISEFPIFDYENTLEQSIGNDFVTNEGDIKAKSFAISPSVSVGVAVWGVGVAVSTAEAEARSFGIDTGSGEDKIINRGNISANSFATAEAVNVSVSVGGVAASADALWDSGTTAEAFSDGIIAGEGDDDITNFGTLNIGALAVAPSVNAAVGIFGVAAAFTDATSDVRTTGIDAGNGNNAINNNGSIFSTSISNADAIAASINIFGVGVTGNTVWDGGVTSNSSAMGITAGIGDDVITNKARIEADSTAVSFSGNLPFTVGGVVAALSTSTATADATAINSNDGIDTIFNSGELTANADATAVTVTGSIAVFGVAAASDAAWNGGTHGSATAYGINAGKAADSVFNNASIDAHSIVRANSTQIALSIIGATGSLATSTSNTESHAIAGGTGNDDISNLGDISSVADARATSVAVSISGVGLAAAADSWWDGGTGATANAFGISGGEGDDIIQNYGNIHAGFENNKVSADTDSVNVAVSTSVGVTSAIASSTAISNGTAIDGGSGDDTIFHYGDANAYTSADAGGVSVSVTGILGAALANSFVDDATKAEATGNGIAAGEGMDSVFTLADSNIDVHSNAKTKATNVALIVTGVANADASTRSISHVNGITGGNGDDEIDHSGNLTATATSESLSRGIGFTGFVATVTDTSSTAEANAHGISGDDGIDQIINRNTVSAESNADAYGQSIGINVAGATISNASITADANAYGLDGGLDNDSLINLGTLFSNGNAVVYAQSIGINGVGAAISDASATANVKTVGVNAGLGNDTITNQGSVESIGSATVDARSFSLSIAGAAINDASVAANVDVLGFNGGLGDDTIMNNGSVVAKGNSTVEAVALGLSAAGATINDASSIANVDVTGVNGDDGKDTLANFGDVSTEATSISNAKSTGINGVGYSAANANATSLSNSVAMSGGEDHDALLNAETASIAVTSNATVNANGVSINLAGVSDAEAVTSSTSTAFGLHGGAGDDYVENAGILSVDSASQTNVDSYAFTLIGASFNKIGSTATSSASGLNGGDGIDEITNSGQLLVNTNSILNTSSSSWSLVGYSGNDNDMLNVTTTALGISGGNDSDSLENSGVITVNGDSVMTVNGSSDAIVGGASTGITVSADTFSKGMDGGAGNDVIKNFSDVIVNASAELHSNQASFTFIGSPSTGANLTANANAMGFDGGAGDDQIFNEAFLRVRSDASITSDGKVESTLGIGETIVSSLVTTDAKATGIRGGDGDDFVINVSNIETNTNFNSQSSSNANTGGFFADGVTLASTEASSLNRGVNLNHGQNEFFNEDIAEIKVVSEGSATSTAITDGDFILEIGINAEATANTNIISNQAQAILAANGNNYIQNAGKLNVDITTENTSISYADGASLLVRGDGTAITTANANYIKAVGIEVGNGDNTIFNLGELAVNIASTGKAYSTSDADGINALSQTAAIVHLDNSRAIGIEVGDGNNMIANHGNINVIASPKVLNAFTKAVSGFGVSIDSYAHSLGSANNAHAIGISAGNGNNNIWNTGNLNIATTPSVYASSTAKGVGIDGDATAIAIAEANNALAVGIQTGNGKNTILNDGEIIVTAAPTADAIAEATAGSGIVNEATEYVSRKCAVYLPWPFDMLCKIVTETVTTVVDKTEVFGTEDPKQYEYIDNARAIGIQTGSGDDLVVNNGSIITFINGIEGAGIGITTGAGDDTVLLSDGSKVKGSIDLGADNDTLHLQGAPIVSGSITGGSGINSLVFDGAGSFDNALNNFSQTTKEGEGLYSVYRLASMQQLNMKRGTLSIEAPNTGCSYCYKMPTNSRFEASVYADGTNGMLNVNGIVKLDGKLVINKEDKPYNIGRTEYTVLHATGLLNDFTSKNVPTATPLLHFDVNNTLYDVQVFATANPITSIATSEAETQIASALDSMTASIEDDVSRVIAEFQSLQESGFNRAFASLNPTSFDSSTVITGAIQTFNSAAENRLANIRAQANEPRYGYEANSGPNFLSGAEALMFSQASFASEVSAPLFNLTSAKQQPLKNAWLVEFGNSGTKNDKHNHYNNIDSSTSGVNFGMDYFINDSLTMGISYGYATSGISQNDSLSATNVRSELSTVYSNYLLGSNTYLESLMTLGRNNYDNARFINVGDFNQVALSKHDSQLFSSRFTLGHSIKTGDFINEFRGSLQYLSLKEEGFDETGTGGVGLSVDARHIQDVRSELEWRTGYNLKMPYGLFNMQFNASWMYDVAQDDRNLNVHFIDAPSNGFTISGGDSDPESFRIGSALTFVGNNDLSITARINMEQRSDQRNKKAMLQARYLFD